MEYVLSVRYEDGSVLEPIIKYSNCEWNSSLSKVVANELDLIRNPGASRPKEVTIHIGSSWLAIDASGIYAMSDPSVATLLLDA